MSTATAVSVSFSGRVGIFNYSLGLELGMMVLAEPQSLVSVPNINGLNPKSLQGFDVKAYVLLISIRLLDGTSNMAAPLMLFCKSRLIPAPSLTLKTTEMKFFKRTSGYTLLGIERNRYFRIARRRIFGLKLSIIGEPL